MGNADSSMKDGEEGELRELTPDEFRQLTSEQQKAYVRYQQQLEQRRTESRRIPARFIQSPRMMLSPKKHANGHGPTLSKNRNDQNVDTQAKSISDRDNQNLQTFEQVNMFERYSEQRKSHMHQAYTTQSDSHTQNANNNNHVQIYSNAKPQLKRASSLKQQDSSNSKPLGLQLQKKPNNRPNKTVDIMMYPASHNTNVRPKIQQQLSSSSLKISKMMSSLKLKVNDDWEKKWEDDNDEDDEDEEDEEEKQKGKDSIFQKTIGAITAAQYPFRTGIDVGHSSSSPMKRPLPGNKISSPNVPPQITSTSNKVTMDSVQNERSEQRAAVMNGSLNNQTGKNLSQSEINNLNNAFNNITTGYNAIERPRLELYTMLRVLGKGSFGKVVLVRKRIGVDCGNLYAMKILRKSHLLRKHQIERTKTERKVLSIVDHPFIMKLYSAFQTEDKLYFVLEYCSGGELFFHLSRYRRFPERVARFYAAELLLALGHLHRRHIIFRDLKPENVLLDAAGHVKLGDFGLSKDGINDPCQGAMSVCGTPEYMAPEVTRRDGHGFCVDYWGLGMLVFEMMTSLPPWYTTDRQELTRRLLYAPLEIPDYVGPVAQLFVGSLLERNPRRRLGVQGIRSVMEHSFFEEIQWKSLATRRESPPIKPCEGWSRAGNPSSTPSDHMNLTKHNNALHQKDSRLAQQNMTEKEIDGFTSNFDKHFTRMPVNTEDNTSYVQNVGNDKEVLNDKTFVGFTFDEIDDHATKDLNAGKETSNNPTISSPQSNVSRQKDFV